MRGDFCELCGPPERAQYLVYRVSKAGRRSERKLCETCARQSEKILLGNSGLPLVDLLGVLTTENSVTKKEQNRTKVCPRCGNTIGDVTESGMVGCSTCYTVFKAEIDQVIEKLHGRPGKAV